MNNFQIPENFDLETGWFVLKGMYSKEDVEKARAIVYTRNQIKLDNSKMEVFSFILNISTNST